MTNWPTKKLGEICDINGGDAAPQDYAVFSSDGVPFVRMQDLGRYHVTDNLIETRDKIKTEAINKLRIKIFPKGSIILPRSGSVFANHRAILGVDAVVVSHIAILNNYKGVEPRYLFWYLTKLDIGRHAVKTSNVDSISFQRLGKFEIPIPALNIQKQIVGRLDKIAEAQKLNDELIQKSDELYRSLLHNELNAKLKNQNEKLQFKIKKLGDENIVKIVDGDRGKNYPPKNEFQKSGYCLFLNTKNVTQTGFVFNETDFISKERDEKLRKGKLQKNDIVLTTRGTVGNSALYDDSVGFNHIRINSGMVILRPNIKEIIPKFLWILMSSGEVQRQFKQILSGTAQPQLPITNLVKTKFSLLPLKTQKHIVAKLSAVQKYKTQLFAQKSKLKELFNSALSKSMSNK